MFSRFKHFFNDMMWNRHFYILCAIFHIFHFVETNLISLRKRFSLKTLQSDLHLSAFLMFPQLVEHKKFANSPTVRF